MGARTVVVAAGLLCACAGLLPRADADQRADANREMQRIQEQSRQREAAEEQRRAQHASEAMAEMQRIAQESRAQDNAKKRQEACTTKWHTFNLKQAEHSRLNPPQTTGAEGIPTGPSELYKVFGRYAATLEKQLDMGCDVHGRAEFEVEWAYLQQEEAARIARLKEREQQLASEHARREDERAAFEEQFATTARKRGFKRVEFGRSLAEVLQTLVEDASPVASLRKVAIEFGYADQGFVAQQSLGGGQAIFASSDTDTRLWVVAPGVSMYEGTPLSALVSEDQPCFVVTGTKSYRTVTGAAAQAFVVKPAW